MCLCSKQSSLFSIYAQPSGGKLKGKWSIALLVNVMNGETVALKVQFNASLDQANYLNQNSH